VFHFNQISEKHDKTSNFVVLQWIVGTCTKIEFIKTRLKFVRTDYASVIFIKLSFCVAISKFGAF
jgi:hypothetical protein